MTTTKDEAIKTLRAELKKIRDLEENDAWRINSVVRAIAIDALAATSHIAPDAAGVAQGPQYDIPDGWVFMVKGLINELDQVYKALANDPAKVVVSIGQFRRLNTAKSFIQDHLAASDLPARLAAAIHGEADAIMQSPAIAPEASELPQNDELDSLLYDALAEQLGDLYSCGRVWSAWGVGTMSEDDFSIASEDDDIVANFVSAARAAIANLTKKD